MTESNKDNREQNTAAQSNWANSLSRVAITLIIVSGIVFTMTYFFDVPKELVKTADNLFSNRVDELKDIASAFKRGTVITEFRSYTTKVTSSNNLQVASLETIETFTKSDARDYWPDVEVEIRAPVEYVFYLDLMGEWEFIVQNQDSAAGQAPEIIVRAPEIRWNKPSVDISEMDYRVVKRGLFRNTNAIMAQLQKEISAICQQRASEKIDLIRAIARENTRAFIQDWFVNVMFKDAKVKPHIKALYFADEVPRDVEPDSLAAPLIEENI